MGSAPIVAEPDGRLKLPTTFPEPPEVLLVQGASIHRPPHVLLSDLKPPKINWLYADVRDNGGPVSGARRPLGQVPDEGRTVQF